MPSSRKLPPASLRRHYAPAIRICTKCRLYGYATDKARSVKVPQLFYRPITEDHPPYRYTLAEEALGVGVFIHDCDIEAVNGRAINFFKVYFTRHAQQPSNVSLPSSGTIAPWHGQILVARVSQGGTGYHINLKRGDVTTIHRIVRQ
ncbi:hypothetical protein BV20DRAFT_1056545 [Pilatotrama ljubarskyi]|nr:hypothetical protein BV20DRAFT_1056545 [Pilatotrama ljubarskyi]